MFEPQQKDVTKGIFKLVDGVWHKRCNGPAHEEPTYLPATEKYFYRRKTNKDYKHGKFSSVCRLCSCWASVKSSANRGMFHGLVPLVEVRHIYVEGVNRVGLYEFAKRVGISDVTMRSLYHGKQKHVRKAHVRSALLELISIRRKNERSAPQSSITKNVKNAHGKNSSCSGCGCHISSYTEGCPVCIDRKLKRGSRAREN